MGSTASEVGPATVKEIMATVLARDLVDGEWVEVGANLPVPRAGVLLAHLTHGPNMTVMIAMTKASVLNEPVIEEFELITDQRATRWAEAFYIHNDLVENMKFRRKGVFFAGALQIDGYGNSNLIGTGSEVALCLEAYEQLNAEGVRARLVSMPSWELFDAQDEAYRRSVLPPNVTARLAVEAGVEQGWEKYLGPRGRFIGMKSFGASAPGAALFAHFGFTTANVVRQAKELLGK